MNAQKAHARLKAKQLVLRCFAEKDQDGTWFTMCLDLNLYARGDSFEHARKKLHGVIVAYLKDALVGSEKEHVGDLIPRPAPFYFWFKYGLMWGAATAARVRDASRIKFKESLPLVPAA